jgi:hypothetical protein
LKRIYTILIAVLLALNSFGQKSGGNDSRHSLFTQANLMMSEHYSDSALKTWKILYRMDSVNYASVAYFIGQMLLETPAHKAEALPYLERAASKVSPRFIPDDAYEKSAPPMAYYYLGRALHLNYQFSDAIVNMNLFKKLLSKNDNRQKDIDYWINCCNNGMELMKDPVECKIENIGDSINTVYPDYNPLVTADEQEMIFTSRRIGGMNDATSEKDSLGFYHEDIYISYAKQGDGWSQAKPISPIVNTPGDDASVFISFDGQQLTLFRGSTGTNGSLFVSYLRGNNWSYTREIDSASPGTVNTPSLQSAGACYSPDQRTLYFVSNRPGGFGGTDIYKINLLDSAGKWGKPINLGPNVNTEYDEDAPFIHTDNATLFFSSKGHNTMGGFDIFSSQKDTSGNWGLPKNMGYPINTPDDDVYFSASADGRRGYYSSIRKGGRGEKDIYQITFATPLPVKRVAILVGYLKQPDNSQLPNDIVVKTCLAKTQDTQAVKVNQSTGKFLQVLHPNQTYNVVISSQGKNVFNQNFYLPADSSYFTLSRAFFRTSIVFGDTSNVFVPKPKVPLDSMKGRFVLNDQPIKPLANMAIQLIDDKGKVIQTTLTDKDGYFTFTKLPSDQSYTLEVDVKDPKLKFLKQLYLVNSHGKIVRNYDDKKEDAYLYHDLPSNLNNLSEISRISAIPPKPVRIVSPDADYIEYFKYNADQASNKESSLNIMVTKIAKKLLKDSVLLYIESSASKVPTGAEFSHSNQILAEKRAEAAKKTIIAALKKRAAKYKKLKFEVKASVQGPDYAQDAQAQDKYQNYQYVKVFIR